MGAYFYHKGKIFPLIFYMMCSTEKVFAVQVCPALFSRGFRSSKAYDFDFMVHLMNHTTTPSHLIMDSLGELHSQQEAAPSDQLMDLETEAVMKERVASSTRKGYDGRNISLMIWLFDSNGQQYHYLLEPHIFGKMVEAQHKDSNMLTKNRTHSKKRFYLRAVCRLALTSMNPGVASTIPIKLDILSFTIFTRFLSTFKKRVTKRHHPKHQWWMILQPSACRHHLMMQPAPLYLIFSRSRESARKKTNRQKNSGQSLALTRRAPGGLE
jgi:hypothetical protein